MTDLTMSQFASKDDLLAAQAAHIAELESQLEAIGAGGVEPLRKPAAAQQAVQAAVPVDMRLVPVEFVRGFSDLAHNYSLQAEAPDYYHGVERDAFRDAYERCGRDLAKLRAMLAAAPAHPAEEVPAQAAVPVVRGEVLVTVSGFTGSGKSAIAGEIEIMCRALGLQVEWPDGVTEKNMTHADWTTALELYNPRVRIIERNVPRNTASGADQ